MARSTASCQPALPPAVTDLDTELDRIAKLGIEDLRALWREGRGHEPPEALSKDLIARALAHWLQEEHLGGLPSSLRKLLASISEKGAEPVRRVKAGSVIVREYQGKLHEVMAVPGAFLWQGQIYASLSAIALNNAKTPIRETETNRSQPESNRSASPPREKFRTLENRDPRLGVKTAVKLPDSGVSRSERR